MRSLAMYFEIGELIEVQFKDGANSDTRVSVRGKTSGPLRQAGSFQWTAAVKGLSLLVLRTCAGQEGMLLAGEKDSLASSLDYAVSKQPIWLTEMFGCDSQGSSLAKRMILRTNPERKRPGPVVLGINQLFLRPSEISIFSHGKLCSDADLLNLQAQLECLNMPFQHAIAA
jgi:hypothetical protein